MEKCIFIGWARARAGVISGLFQVIDEIRDGGDAGSFCPRTSFWRIVARNAGFQRTRRFHACRGETVPWRCVSCSKHIAEANVTRLTVYPSPQRRRYRGEQSKPCTSTFSEQSSETSVSELDAPRRRKSEKISWFGRERLPFIPLAETRPRSPRESVSAIQMTVSCLDNAEFTGSAKVISIRFPFRRARLARLDPRFLEVRRRGRKRVLLGTLTAKLLCCYLRPRISQEATYCQNEEALRGGACGFKLVFDAKRCSEECYRRMCRGFLVSLFLFCRHCGELCST